MTPLTMYAAGIGHLRADQLKAVLDRFFPVPSAPSQKAVRERLNDTHPDFI